MRLRKSNTGFYTVLSQTDRKESLIGIFLCLCLICLRSAADPFHMPVLSFTWGYDSDMLTSCILNAASLFILHNITSSPANPGLPCLNTLPSPCATPAIGAVHCQDKLGGVHKTANSSTDSSCGRQKTKCTSWIRKKPNRQDFGTHFPYWLKSKKRKETEVSRHRQESSPLLNWVIPAS